ncbi:MAG: hypothetical protein ACF8R7_13625 [Phycisphaerales bacterium JB039]
MKRTLIIALCAAVGSAASAGPDRPVGEGPAAGRDPGPVPGPVGVDTDNSVNDNFDCYAVGASISAQPGWELWPGGADGVITDAFASSGANSLHLPVTNTDVVHQFPDITDGQVVFSVMTYVRSDANDMAFDIIALNQYDGGGAGTNWSMQVRFDTFIGELESQFRGFFTPMIYDRWVELRAEIDLDADLWDLYYDDVLWAEGQSWTDGSFASGPGIPEFAAIDLWVDFTTHPFGAYLDDVLVTRPGCTPNPTCGGADPGPCGADCYPDCDGSGGLDFFDFLCFQNAFAVGDPYADCDATGALDFFDFLCFQNEFAVGCP